MEYVCHDFLTTVTSLRIWGEKKKNCSLLGALVFPLKTKTHIECVYYLLLQLCIIITQRVIISFYIVLKYTNVS